MSSNLAAPTQSRDPPSCRARPSWNRFEATTLALSLSLEAGDEVLGLGLGPRGARLASPLVVAAAIADHQRLPLLYTDAIQGAR